MQQLQISAQLFYTEFILVRLYRKLLTVRNTLESFHETNQYGPMSVKFLSQGNNDLPLTGFEPMILRLLARHVNHSTTPIPCHTCSINAADSLGFHLFFFTIITFLVVILLILY